MREKYFYVYILATRKDGPLYVGVTGNLQKRISEHKAHSVSSHTAKYNIDQLVWFEQHPNAESAILKEKRLKRWQRAWKKELIESENPNWIDLFQTLPLE